jgi:hypothetical protein
VVPALRASGALAGDSPVPGQIAALCERLGAPGSTIAPPGPLPERWENFLAATARDGTESGVAAARPMSGADGIDAARVSLALPAGEGITIVLTGLISGLITGAGRTTVIFGGLYLGDGPSAASAAADLSMWARDHAGGWHSVSISGWSSDGSNGVTFQAVVVPPLPPATREIEFHVAGSSAPAETGLSGEIRAVIPLEWWSAS